MSPDTLLEPGSTIDGRFRIDRLLGKGGYGEVYEAFQLSMRRSVALKTLRSALASDPTVIERFQNEARFACQLNHPNTVHYYDFGYDTEQEMVYLVMEYLAGETLAERLKRQGPLSLDELTVILEQICGSLAEAHSLGLVHRDVKPENIMLIERAGRANYVKVIDFGIAKAIEHPDEHVNDGLTATGAVLGSPHYMAPEQIRSGELPIDRRADIYALACMVFKALTGIPPFRGRSAMDIATRHLIDTAPTLASVGGDRSFSPELERLIEQSLSKKPEERPTTALVFFERYLEAVGHQLHTPPHLLAMGATPPPAKKPSKPTVIGELLAVDRAGESAPVDISGAQKKKERRVEADKRARRASNANADRLETVNLPPQEPKAAPRRTMLVGLVGVAALVLVAGVVALVVMGGERMSDEADPTPQHEVATETLSQVSEREDAGPDALGVPAEEDVGVAEADVELDEPAIAEKTERPRRADGKQALKNLIARNQQDLAPDKKANDPPAPVKKSPPASKEPLEVSIIVQPWGRVVVAGKSAESRLKLPLAPGRHEVQVHQYGKVVHRQAIVVKEGRTSFTIVVPNK